MSAGQPLGRSLGRRGESGPGWAGCLWRGDGRAGDSGGGGGCIPAPRDSGGDGVPVLGRGFGWNHRAEERSAEACGRKQREGWGGNVAAGLLSSQPRAAGLRHDARKDRGERGAQRPWEGGPVLQGLLRAPRTARTLLWLLVWCRSAPRAGPGCGSGAEDTSGCLVLLSSSRTRAAAPPLAVLCGPCRCSQGRRGKGEMALQVLYPVLRR